MFWSCNFWFLIFLPNFFAFDDFDIFQTHPHLWEGMDVFEPFRRGLW